MDQTRNQVDASETMPCPDFIEVTIPVAANTAVTQPGGSPPAVGATGTPAVNGAFVVKIDLGGARGTATFTWSKDGGSTWEAVGVATAATVALGSTGLTATFATGTYVLNDSYTWTSSDAGGVDLSASIKFPVRVIEVITAGGGTLKVKTSASVATLRTLTGLAAGYRSPPAQFTYIGGTSDGSNVTAVRVWK